MRVLICGDRNWADQGKIDACLKGLDPEKVIIVHGACKGADSMAGAAAEALGFPVRAYPPDWKKYGKAAGPIRNQQMLDDTRPAKVIVFHDNLQESKGSKDMVGRALHAGLPVELWSTETDEPAVLGICEECAAHAH